MNESNHEAFRESLLAEDELGSVIRAHLHIENCIDKILTRLVPQPELLPTLNLDYHAKLDLMCVLGVRKDLKRAFSVLGTLRNKFAHNLSFQLNDSEVNNLYKALPTEQKEHFQKADAMTRKNSELESQPRFSDRPYRDRFVLLAVYLRGLATDIIEEIDDRNA